MATLADLRQWKQENRQLPDGGTLLARQPVLYCAECGADYSANPGDYWNTPESHIFECCGEPLILAFKRSMIVPVEQSRLFDRVVDALLEG